MTAQEWVDIALSGTAVADIGQLDKTTRRALDRAVKAGLLVTWREPWLGCMGPSRPHWTAARSLLGLYHTREICPRR